MVVIRLLLTVVLSVALVAVASPLVHDARQQSAGTAAERSVSQIRGVIDELTTRSDPTRESPGAGRTLTLSIPEASPGSVGIDWLAVGGVPDQLGPEEPSGTDLIAYSIAGSVHVIRLPSVELRVVIDDTRRPDHVPIVLRSSTALRFTYRSGETGPIITVRAQDS